MTALDKAQTRLETASCEITRARSALHQAIRAELNNGKGIRELARALGLSHTQIIRIRDEKVTP